MFQRKRPRECCLTMPHYPPLSDLLECRLTGQSSEIVDACRFWAYTQCCKRIQSCEKANALALFWNNYIETLVKRPTLKTTKDDLVRALNLESCAVNGKAAGRPGGAGMHRLGRAGFWSAGSRPGTRSPRLKSQPWNLVYWGVSIPFPNKQTQIWASGSFK
jgi:hypothetical protein